MIFLANAIVFLFSLYMSCSPSFRCWLTIPFSNFTAFFCNRTHNEIYMLYGDFCGNSQLSFLLEITLCILFVLAFEIKIATVHLLLSCSSFYIDMLCCFHLNGITNTYCHFNCFISITLFPAALLSGLMQFGSNFTLFLLLCHNSI